MAIQTSCSCGRRLVLRDELAGKVIRCPECARDVAVARRSDAAADELVEVVPVVEVECGVRWLDTALDEGRSPTEGHRPTIQSCVQPQHSKLPAATPPPLPG